VPPGWSYDDPWSAFLPGAPGEAALDDALEAAFKAAAVELDAIPLLPPPVALRG
jgi:nucleoporin NUP42